MKKGFFLQPSTGYGPPYRKGTLLRKSDLELDLDLPRRHFKYTIRNNFSRAAAEARFANSPLS